MNWSGLWSDFLSGKPDAIQAVFSILGFVVTALGVVYVAITFRQQKKINGEQQNLNRLAMEKDRRELFPWFTGDVKSEDIIEDKKIIKYGLILKDNKAMDVEIFPIKKSGKLESPIYYPSQVVVPKEGKSFVDLEVIEAAPQPNSGFEKQYLIYYHDQIGRPYTQDLGHDGYKVVLLYPQQVSHNFRERLPLKSIHPV